MINNMEKINIIFLDYDGVVNTLWFQDVNGEPDYNFPKLEQVNNTQAIAWLNKLYRETPYSIVVTSTWRKRDDYKEVLYKAGLNNNIPILGKTEWINITPRGEEIKDWLNKNNKKYNIANFVIVDDDSDMCELNKYLIQTDTLIGFTYYEYQKIKNIFEQNRRI